MNTEETCHDLIILCIIEKIKRKRIVNKARVTNAKNLHHKYIIYV